jgi:predicted ATPase
MLQHIEQNSERARFFPFDELRGLLNLVSSFQRMSLIPDRLRANVPVKRDPTIGPDGFGLSRVYAQLLLQHREGRENVEKTLTRAFNHIDRVDVQQTADNYGLEFVTKESFRIPADRVSDGVLLVFAYLLMSFGEAPSPVLLIEEPETGIHPGLISQVVESLRKLAHGELGERPVQVIVATQSPILLNYVEPAEIRVLHRGDDGATHVTPFDSAPRLAELLEYQSPGEIWVNLGEDYLAGSRRQ